MSEPTQDMHARVHAAMSSPGTYAHNGELVTVIPTACSTIYLTGIRAYKVKRPVNLGYLDFTTLEARRIACEAELSLNATLAPGVYERIVPIRVKDDGRVTLDEHDQTDGDVVNYAICMRRLPADGMLGAVLDAHALDDAQVKSLAKLLASFHATARRGPTIDAHATPDRVLTELRSNAREFADAVHDAQAQADLSPRLIQHAATWLDAHWHRHALTLAQRVREGRIRDGHGDLHAGNICLDPAAATPTNPHGIIIYDRLEFRDDFRCRDVAAEVACLGMSLDACGHRSLSARLVDLYAQHARDPGLAELQSLWRTHYALVRAKVLTLTAMREAPQRATLLAQAAEYLSLAVGYTLAPTPALIMTCGLPGSGKSFIARHIVRATGAQWVRADEVRKHLAGMAPTDRGSEALYTPDVTARVYDEMASRTRAALFASRIVVTDATFRTTGSRASLLAQARTAHARAVIVHCHADEDETRRRLTIRTAASTDASDADFRVYQQMRPTYAAPTAAEATVIDAGEQTPSHVVVARTLEAMIG